MSTPSRAISSRKECGSTTQRGWSLAHPSKPQPAPYFGFTPSSTPRAQQGICAMAEVEAIPAAAIMIHKEADLFLTSLK